MYKTKIEWAETTWNPVTGCLHGCEYCYARRIADRFKGFSLADEDNACAFRFVESNHHTIAEVEALMSRRDKTGRIISAPYPFSFRPTLHSYRLDEPARWKKPRNIFVCSMGDLFGEWVPDQWIEQILEACDNASQHRYLFLTKNSDRYAYIDDLLPHHRRPPHVAEMWFGQSYTGIGDYRPITTSVMRQTFVSIEPILHSLTERDVVNIAATNDWVIVGAETGNRKDKIIPKKEWIQEIADICLQEGTFVFMKESLRDLMGDDFKQEFPWGCEL